MQAFTPGTIVCSELLPSPIGWFWNESPQHWWSIRHELGCLIIIPQNDKGASNSQTDEELDVSMAQLDMFLRNWGYFASNSSLGGLLGMALDDRGLMQLPSEPKERNMYRLVIVCQEPCQELCQACASKTLTEILMHSPMHSFIYSSKTTASHLWAKLCVTVSEKNLQYSKKHNKTYKI